MTHYNNKVNLKSHYDELQKTSFISTKIEDQIGIVFDEFKNYIEGLTCCNSIHHNIIDREARFQYALADLKSLVWQRFSNYK